MQVHFDSQPMKISDFGDEKPEDALRPLNILDTGEPGVDSVSLQDFAQTTAAMNQGQDASATGLSVLSNRPQFSNLDAETPIDFRAAFCFPDTPISKGKL